MAVGSELHKAGAAKRRQLMGDAAVEASAKGIYSDPVMQKFIDVATETVFGALWTRPGLDDKTRALICVISDTCTGREPELALHLRMALRPVSIAGLDETDGRVTDNQRRAGLRYFFRPGIRGLREAEIPAQIAAFRATGPALDHVNAHRHMHLHPTVARLVVAIGRDYGMRAVRLPAEPKAPLRRAFPGERLPAGPPGFAVAALRRRLRQAGLATNDQVFGIAWSGAMVESRILGLLPYLPAGVSELYCHPATERTPELAAALPGYRNPEELAALLSSRVKRRIEELRIGLVSYGDLAAPG